MPIKVEKINEVLIKKNVPLISSNQVNMRFDSELLEQAKELAQAQDLPYTTFLASLLKENIERLWKVYQKTGSGN